MADSLRFGLTSLDSRMLASGMQGAVDGAVWSVLLQVVGLLGAALLLGVLFERFRQSAILGYLLAGTLLGPHVLNFVHEGSGVPVIAELGVSLLLFAIGLEFSLKRLLRLGSIAAGGGSLQVVLTLLAAAGVALLVGLEMRTALALGAVVALSSTACVLRILTDRTELDSVHGRAALGILLLQDVAVVPLLLLVTMLGGAGTTMDMVVGLGKSAWADPGTRRGVLVDLQPSSAATTEGDEPKPRSRTAHPSRGSTRGWIGMRGPCAESLTGPRRVCRGNHARRVAIRDPGPS